MAFTEPQLSAITGSLYISSILNLLGSSFTITTYLLFKDASNYSTSLIFYLAISDLCSAIADSPLWILVNQKEGLYCDMQGFLLMFGLCASMLWGFFIGVHIFLVLYKDMEMEEIRKYRYVFHAIVWGYSLFASIYPLYKQKYVLAFPDSKYSWCFVTLDYRMFMIFPDAIIFFLLIIFYFMNYYKIKSIQSFAAKQIHRQMSIYLLVFTIINVFAIVNRLQEYFNAQKDIFVLYLLQFITEPLQGFLNAFAYVWNEPAYLERYKQLFMNCMQKPAKVLSTNNSDKNERERLMSLVCYEPIP